MTGPVIGRFPRRWSSSQCPLLRALISLPPAPPLDLRVTHGNDRPCLQHSTFPTFPLPQVLSQSRQTSQAEHYTLHANDGRPCGKVPAEGDPQAQKTRCQGHKDSHDENRPDPTAKD